MSGEVSITRLTPANDPWPPFVMTLEAIPHVEQMFRREGMLIGGWYIIGQDGKPELVTPEEFCQWDSITNRQIARTLLNRPGRDRLSTEGVLVSTMFSGYNLARQASLGPICYESRVLGVAQADFVQYADRAYALQIHDELVKLTADRMMGRVRSVRRLMSLAELANAIGRHQGAVPDGKQ